MAFKPVDYYHLAGWLYQQTIPQSEALARAVISKSYYGAFLEARDKVGITDKSAGVHKKVHDHYFKSGTLLWQIVSMNPE